MADFTIQELFESMPRYANESAIQDVDKTIQWELTGEEPGYYYLEVKDGTVTTHEGQADNPDATIVTPSELWKRIATGQENGAVAFMSGKFKATGDLSLLMKMQNWFEVPRQ
ncbi:MAG: SCP2 sterol-binding domain-containing protein [Chloroflexota bacterium]|nr:SCP2 sterol-binding domain-containing protein [Chloroflexota bacterium]